VASLGFKEEAYAATGWKQMRSVPYLQIEEMMGFILRQKLSKHLKKAADTFRRIP